MKVFLKIHKITVVFFLAFSCISAIAQSHRLIVRADDMGNAHATNLACMKVLQKGIATSVEVMVPGAWFIEAADLLREHPDIDVGIHLVLTSEWTGIKWRPLTDAPSLVDENGYFYPRIWPGENDTQALRANDWKIDEVEAELRAQIEMARKHIPQISHVTGHMGCTHMNDEVEALVKKLTREYGLHIWPDDYQVMRFPSLGGSEVSLQEKKNRMLEFLDELKPGTYMIVTHPGLDVPEMQAFNHKGYTNVAFHRLNDTQLLTDADIRKKIQDLGIALIGYDDLVK